MKKRLKLYKSGKLWLCATIVFAGLVIGMSSEGTVHADDVSNNGATVQSTLTTDTGHTDSSNNIVNNQVPVDHQTQDNDLNANVGSLDTYQIQTNSQNNQVILHASGWQATGHSDDQRYRYAIAYDNTLNKELNRQRITPQIRADVQNVYPNIANSRLSGFDVNFNLPNNLAGHSISIIARYSDDEINGEGHHTDYWSSPIIFDNQNRASLDELSSNDHGDLIVSGWHATNLALGKNYHYIITYDQTHNHEIARAQVIPTERGDVAQAFPTIANAKNSGFHVQFKLDPEYAQDSIEFISRWTDDPVGNGDAVDYWFAPVQKVNRGNLDSWNLSSGDLTVSGWHANDAAIYEPYH
ncbi:KxYKxGKxW signal peptide domain-containing protein, partial [Limosilactobacillus coleohominis]